MSRYRKLVSNTIVFAIGTFSSKLMVFLLTRLYTAMLTTAEYSVTDTIVNTSNLLIPLVMVAVNEAVMRFGIDNSAKKSDVFTIGLSVSFMGFAVFLCAWPLMRMVPIISEYTALICLYVFAANLHGVCAQFVRSLGLVRLYAFEGILATLTIIIFNILFMVVLGWGINGYVLSVVVSNLISVLFLFWAARLRKYVKLGPGSINRSLRTEMLRYSLPLIPNSTFWWITNVSGRFFVIYFCGGDVNGLYSVAYKIPTIITLIAGIFSQAWQISAFSEDKGPDRDKFYSEVFAHYQTVAFLVASGVLLLLKPLTQLLTSPAYHSAWEYSPLLILSVVYSCFAMFFSSFYMAEKQNSMSLLTTLLGATCSTALNVWLIPVWGPQGAAFASAVSYFLMFGVRLLDTRRFVQLDVGWVRLLLNLVLLACQSALLLYGLQPAWVYQLLLFGALLLLNLRDLCLILYSLIAGMLKMRE